MKELFIKFNFNVRIEVEDESEIQDQIVGWWFDVTELPDYEILEKEEE